MGCDGGTIPRRDELVRLKKKPETVRINQKKLNFIILYQFFFCYQKDKDADRLYRWRHCALTQNKLQQPIVMCGLGRLYSKQNIIEKLLEKELPENCAHIKSLKDIKDLKLTPNPAYSEEDEKNAPFVCKLIGLEMSGQFRFVGLWSCGCVMAERALKEINAKVCSLCQKPYSEEDVVILNGNEEDLEVMQSRMLARTARMKAEKKDKKIKVKIEQAETVTSSEVKADESKKIETSSKMKSMKAPTSLASSSLKREIITNVIGSDPACKKTKKDYSVAKDKNATEVYKSIFTSHESETKQERAHWVTYNPHYN